METSEKHASCRNLHTSVAKRSSRKVCSLQLFNTKKRKKEIFKPIEKNKVKIYTCGPTVYDSAHIGNLRAYLFADLLYRYLKYFKGYEVKWVMNITDIDDKTIKGSKKTGDPMKNLKEYTQKYEKNFFEDLKKLKIGVNPLNGNFVFHKNPRATEHIKEMQSLIQKIMKNGYGYIKNGSVYFSVLKYGKKHTYGQLLNIDLEGFQNGVRIDTDEYSKDHLKDFVLWKVKKKDEPYWDFTIDGINYPGRPGWHIECSAMSHKHLGETFDIHTGGVDLIFPHHENEIAQSTSGYGKNPVHYWCHNEHLMVDNQKMSKSLGNFYTIDDLEKKGIEAKYFRYIIISNHYRNKFNFTMTGLTGAKASVQRIQELIDKLLDISGIKGKNINTLLQKTEKNIEKALDDDLNTAEAMQVIFDLVRDINILIDQNKLGKQSAKKTIELFQKINKIFDIFSLKKKMLDKDIAKLIDERNKARKEKNFTKSDKIRAELQKRGIEIQDTENGTIWRKT